MIRQGHIGRSGAVLLLWFALAGKALLTFPASMIADALTAAWMVIVGGGLVTLLAFLPGVALMRRFPGMSFARAADEAGGLVVGKVLSFAFPVFLLIPVAFTLREFAEVFDLYILPRTPVQAIVITLSLGMAYSAYVGVESLGRLSIFVTPWLIVSYVLILFGTFPGTTLLRLFPLWGYGALDVLGDSVLRSSLYAEIAILLIMFPYLREKAEAVPIGAWAILLTMFLLGLTQVMVTGLLGVESTDRFAFPVLELGRMVSLGRFFTRLDPVLVFLWMYVAAIKLSVMFWASSTTLAETLRLEDYRPLLAPLAAIVVAGSLLPRGLRETSILDFEYYHRWSWVVGYIVPLVLWALAVVRGKRGAAGPAGGGEEAGEPS